MGVRAAYGKGWKGKRRRVLDRDGWICQLCGVDLRGDGVRASVDHLDSVIEQMDAGESISAMDVPVDRLRAVCGSCNSRLGARVGNRRRGQARQAAKGAGLWSGLRASWSGSPWESGGAGE